MQDNQTIQSPWRRWLLAAVCVLASFPAGAQEAPAAPTPEFSLLGDVSQKITYLSTAWDRYPTSQWAFTADLKPKFTYGAVLFQADSTWNLPLTGKLPTPPATGDAISVAVSEAYFRVTPLEGLDLTLGQKRFAIGVGQTFTVGDSINPVIGFFDQKTGFRGFTAEWSPVSWASVSGAYSTEGLGTDKPAGAGQVSLLLDKLQVTGSLSAKTDTSFNPAVGASYDLFGVILTAEGAAEFLPQGLRPAGAVGSWKAPDAWSAPALSGSAGARWTVTLFDIDWTVAGEYLHWGQGFTPAETDAWKPQAAVTASGYTAATAALAATKGVRSQENAFVRFSATSGTEYSLTSFAAIDLQDGSALGQVAAVWAPWDNFEFDLTLQTSGGNSGSTWEYLNSTHTRYQISFATTYHF